MKIQYLCVFFLLILVVPLDAGRIIESDSQVYVNFIEVQDDNYPVGTYPENLPVLVGYGNGQLELLEQEESTIYQSNPGYNQIIDGVILENDVVLVTEYNFTQTFDRDTRIPTQINTYNYSLTGAERLDDDLYVLTTSAPFFYINNITSNQQVQYNILQLGFSGGQSPCVNCPILDVEYENEMLYMLHGEYLMMIDVMTRSDPDAAYWIEINSPGQLKEWKGGLIHIPDQQSYVEVYNYDLELISRVDSDGMEVIDATMLEDVVVLAGFDRLFYRENVVNSDRGYEYSFDSVITSIDAQTSSERLLVGTVDPTNRLAQISLDDFDRVALINPDVVRFMMWLIIVVLIGTGTYLFRKRVYKYWLFLQKQFDPKHDFKASGFDTMEEFETAKTKGFYDKFTMEMVQKQGYETMASYQQALQAAADQGYSTPQQMKDKERVIPARLSDTTTLYYYDFQFNHTNNRESVAKLVINSSTRTSTLHFLTGLDRQAQSKIIDKAKHITEDGFVWGLTKYELENPEYRSSEVRTIGEGTSLRIEKSHQTNTISKIVQQRFDKLVDRFENEWIQNYPRLLGILLILLVLLQLYFAIMYNIVFLLFLGIIAVIQLGFSRQFKFSNMQLNWALLIAAIFILLSSSLGSIPGEPIGFIESEPLKTFDHLDDQVIVTESHFFRVNSEEVVGVQFPFYSDDQKLVSGYQVNTSLFMVDTQGVVYNANTFETAGVIVPLDKGLVRQFGDYIVVARQGGMIRFDPSTVINDVWNITGTLPYPISPAILCSDCLPVAMEMVDDLIEIITNLGFVYKINLTTFEIVEYSDIGFGPIKYAELTRRWFGPQQNVWLLVHHGGRIAVSDIPQLGGYLLIASVDQTITAATWLRRSIDQSDLIVFATDERNVYFGGEVYFQDVLFDRVLYNLWGSVDDFYAISYGLDIVRYQDVSPWGQYFVEVRPYRFAVLTAVNVAVFAYPYYMGKVRKYVER